MIGVTHIPLFKLLLKLMLKERWTVQHYETFYLGHENEKKWPNDPQHLPTFSPGI